MIRRTSLSLLLVGVLLSTVACSGNTDQITSPPEQSQSSQPVQHEKQAWGTEINVDVPFSVFVEAESDSGIDVLRVRDEDTEELTGFELLGHTVADGAMPGPSVRTVLDADTSFAALMHIDDSDEAITDLSQISSELGTVSSKGVFTPKPSLSEPSELPGSNPDDLYFEPQNASSGDGWVLWREGSAGAKGTMPTMDALDWRIVAWDRTTDSVTELASSFLLTHDRFVPRSPWDGAPTTDGTYAYYEAYIGAESDDYQRSVIRVPLLAPGEVEIVSDGTMPAANAESQRAYWVIDNDTVVDGDNPLFRIESDQWRLADLNASARFVVATVANGEDPAWLLVWSVEEDKLQSVIEVTSDSVAASLSGSNIAWGNGSGSSDPTMFYLNLNDPKPRMLGQTLGYSAPCIGPNQIAIPSIDANGAIEWEFMRF